MNMNHHQPSPMCDRFAPLLPVLDDVTLNSTEAQLAREHLRTCSHCQAERETYRQIDRVLIRRYSPARLPRRPTEDIMRSISDRAAKPALFSPSRRSPRIHNIVSGISACAAATLLVVFAVFVFQHRLVSPGGPVDLGPPQYSFPSTQGMIADISMVSPNEGWALGQTLKANGVTHDSHEVTFYHYLNGTWTPTSVQISEDLSTGGVSGFNGTISMDSTTDGWAVAANFNQVSAVLHYSKGVWKEVSTGYIAALHAFSPHSVWAISGSQLSEATILHYDGTSWIPQQITGLPSGENANPMMLSMQSDEQGWALAEIANSDYSSVKYVVLQDAQGTWTVHSTINLDESTNLTSLAMLSATEGWAIGEQIVADSHGNTTHVPTRQILFHYTNGAWHSATLPDSSAGYTIAQRIIMRTPTDGWIIGEEQNAYLGATTDNFQQHTRLWHYDGHKWQSVAFPKLGFAVDAITGLAFTSSGTVWASGYTSDIAPSQTVQDTDILAHAMPILLSYNGSWSLYKQGS
jgi:hypothetical protein